MPRKQDSQSAEKPQVVTKDQASAGGVAFRRETEVQIAIVSVKPSLRWLDLFYQISTENSIIGASRHLLYIGRRKHVR